MIGLIRALLYERPAFSNYLLIPVEDDMESNRRALPSLDEQRGPPWCKNRNSREAGTRQMMINVRIALLHDFASGTKGGNFDAWHGMYQQNGTLGEK